MRKWLNKKNGFSLLLLSGIFSLAQATSLDGASLSLVWLWPFIGLLGSIALFPVLMPYFWHQHFGKVTLFWIMSLLIPYSLSFGLNASFDITVHAVITEYLPFSTILFTLYTLSGGILLEGDLQGTPRKNTIILALGTALASVMGTTGASMLLIRPILKANAHRQHKVHIVIFFIFLVANIGGGVTPLGDPPLFLGFLKGITFIWTVEHMFFPVLFVSTLLLILFYNLDCYFFKKESVNYPLTKKKTFPLRLYGKFNLLLLLGVTGVVLLSGIWQLKTSVNILGVSVLIKSLVRDTLLLLIAILSLLFTSKQIRAGNDFNWGPVLEVAKLFAGIFITIAPVVAILDAGQAGKLSFILNWVSTQDGQPIDTRYFWLTGFLSGFLDNAPTYLIFFNLADGDPNVLMGPMASTLLAISMGSVFMGAYSYIGNAPNFMVKTIAEQYHINMPSFFGYMKWSMVILFPIFVLTTLVFF